MKKNKVSIRELREQQAQQKKQGYQQKDAIRNEQLRAAQLEEEKKKEAAMLKEFNSRLHPVKEKNPSTEPKSTAKAAGLKSTFVLGNNSLLMTSFGKGNDAVIEKRVESGTVKDLSKEPAFSAVPEDDARFRIDGRVKNASADNPLHHPEDHPAVRDDMIHARSALEKLYYGENFQDNIHIQAVYSILDIEKILSVHINNIVYMLNNFLREEGEDLTDLVGSMFDDVTYEKFMAASGNNIWKTEKFRKLCSTKQLGYLNLEIIPEANPRAIEKKTTKKKEDPNTLKIKQRDFYYMLTALSTMRNMLAHGNPTQNIYKIEGFGKGNVISDILTALYQDRIHELNTYFLDRAQKNLVILFRAFGIKEKETKAAFVRDYYDFTVRKSQKNTGFSIKLLREHMTAEIEPAFVLRDMKYDSVRGKLYPFVDFALYRYYSANPAEAENLVNNLRASMNEKEKDAVYSKEALRIWPKEQVGNLILKHILPEMSGDVIRAVVTDPDVTEDMFTDIMITPEATDFSKMIYMLTLFINGKEINDLLTTLIHQFENIAAFQTVLKSEGLRTGFTKDFKLFGCSAQVAKELRVINNIARMNSPAAFAKEVMYTEAFRVLGIQADEEQLKAEVKDILDPEKSGKGSQKRGLRNFVANNVIESVRFRYLIRYGNVNKLKGLAQSRVVVAFVLKDIPDDQIRRYYVDVGEKGDVSLETMRSHLAERLTGFSFENIRDVRQSGIEENLRAQQEKQQKQALVRLYLTVLYLALKNLVYINSRYFLAFHCVERDRLLLNPEYWKSIADDLKYKPEYGYTVFAKEFLKKYPQHKRVAAYMEQNFANADDWAIRTFRNKVEHLDAIRNADMYLGDVKAIHSWFELYHYIMQRRIMDQFKYDSTHESSRTPGRMIITEEELNPKTREYFALVNKYHSCCKDFIKALNTPFAYNLPRFKNLSVDELFDRNRTDKKKGDGKELKLPEDAPTNE